MGHPSFPIIVHGDIIGSRKDFSAKTWSKVGPATQPQRREIWSLANLPNNRIAAGLGNGTVQILEASSGMLQHTLEVGKGMVMALALMPDGRLACGTPNGQIALCDLSGGRPAHILDGLQGRVQAFAVLPDGRLASGTNTGQITVWDVQAGRPMTTSEIGSGGVWDLQLTHNGRLAASTNLGALAILDANHKHIEYTPSEHEDRVWTLAPLSNGDLASGSDDGTIRIWDTANWTCKSVLAPGAGSIWQVLELQDGLLACGSKDGSVGLWDLKSGNLVKMLRYDGPCIQALLATPEGNLITGDAHGDLIEWDIPFNANSESAIIVNDQALKSDDQDGAYLVPPALYAGDSFGAVVDSFGSAIQLVLEWADRLHPIQGRFVVHQNEINYGLESKDFHKLEGPALWELGKKMDALKRSGTRFHLSTIQDSIPATTKNAVMALVDLTLIHSSNWTPNQHRIAMRMLGQSKLPSLRQKQVAELLGVSPQHVSKTLKEIGYSSWASARLALLEWVSDLDRL